MAIDVAGLAHKLGHLADRADSFARDAELPVPASILAAALRSGMQEIRDELRRLYVEATGDNPWNGS